VKNTAMKWVVPLVSIIFATIVGVGIGMEIAVQLTDLSPPICLTFNPVTQTPLVVLPAFSLTPAPPGETPLQRWKRTKADWDRATKMEEDAIGQVQHSISFPAIEAYTAAEDALQKAQCDKVCVPEKQP